MKIYNCFYEIVIKSLSFTIPSWVQILRRNYVILTLLLALNFIAATPAMAANLSGDFLKQPATEITVSLGNAANELKFEPNHLEFEVGKHYQLQLNNPSQLKHYFTAKDFAASIHYNLRPNCTNSHSVKL